MEKCWYFLLCWLQTSTNSKFAVRAKPELPELVQSILQKLQCYVQFTKTVMNGNEITSFDKLVYGVSKISNFFENSCIFEANICCTEPAVAFIIVLPIHKASNFKSAIFFWNRTQKCIHIHVTFSN